MLHVVSLGGEETTCCFSRLKKRHVVSLWWISLFLLEATLKQITNMCDLTISDSGAGDKPGTKPQIHVGFSNLGCFKDQGRRRYRRTYRKEPSAETCRGLLLF